MRVASKFSTRVRKLFPSTQTRDFGKEQREIQIEVSLPGFI